MERSTSYILIFASAVCFVCSIVVSGAAVSLKDRQALNKKIDMQKKVLLVAGTIRQGESVADADIPAMFEKSIDALVIDLKTGQPTATKAADFDQLKASKDPALSKVVDSKGAKDAGVNRTPKEAKVFRSKKDGRYIFPIEGKGLWSTLYGFLAVNKDLNTVEGIIFYAHGETPGLGGEIENPRWTGLWPGKKVFGKDGTPAISVVKGQAKPGDPYQIDGLSGATITARGVMHLVRFWMSEEGYGNYMKAQSSTSTGMKGGLR